MHSISLVSDAVFDDINNKRIPNRTFTEDFKEEIDEATFVRQYNSFHLRMRMLCLCLALMKIFA